MELKRGWTALQIVATTLLLVALFRDFDWRTLWRIVTGVPVWFYGLSLAAVATGHLLYVRKWQLVLRGLGRRLPFRPLAELYFVGLFFSNFLPTAVGGDAARVYYLGKTRGYGFATASVVLDRLFGLCSITLWATGLVWTLQINSETIQLLRSVLTAGSVILLGAIATGFAFPDRAVQWALGRLPDRFQRPAGAIQRALEWRVTLRAHPWIPLVVALIVLLYYALLALLYLRFFALAGQPGVPFAATLAVVLSIGVLSNVPIAINGIGLREQLHFLLFAALGVSKELAVSASLLIFAQTLVLSLLGYLAWVRWRVLAGGFDRGEAT